jgi:endonuclease/exonuclease/phosphatase family metal-dependent hydrolase
MGSSGGNMAKRCRLGTFNVYNLVNPGVTYYGNKRYSDNTFARKVEWLAGQLDQMDADIVGFQEVFHKDALSAVLDNTKSKDYSGRAVAFRKDPGPDPSPAVAIASRYNILEQTIHEAIPRSAHLAFDDDSSVPIETFSRPVLECVIDVPDLGPVVVFVAHLKSKRPEYLEGEKKDFYAEARASARSLVRRAVEATGLRALLLARLTRANKWPVVLLGDLNDAARAVTTTVISGTPPWRFAKLAEKRKVWDRLLYNASELISRRSLVAPRYTHIFNGYFEVLDHIFVSEEFYRSNPKAVGEVEYVRFYTDHLVDSTLASDALRSWQSDHGQVVATIKISMTGG